MMQQPKNTTSELLEAINFPKKGEVLQGVKVLSSKAAYENDILSYEIILPKGTKSKAVPKILRQFFSTQVISTAGNLVVKHHDYTVSPSNGNVCVKGSMHIASVVRMNPSLQEFDEEYSSMEMTNPETYFKKYEYRGFNSPQFRAKLFSMVSYMGENYGYCDDKCIYHRRASLIMPKIKITKAVPSAKMMYHTHPKKDEPSLSSADDYLIYMDLSHEPRSIRHFCTVMEDRMDHFEIKPKKGSKQNFLKLDEDKIIEEIDAKISDLEKKWDAKMPKEGASKEDNLRYCENITRDLVKWMNTKYGKYFSFKYKCHYRVKKNPPEPTADDLHLKDEFLEKAVSDTRTRTYGWPEFDTGKMPHEIYAYWHQAYYTQHVKDTFMTLGVTPKGTNQRRYNQYMNKRFEGTTFTNLDALNILNLAYDIAAQDAKIRDGSGFKSRMVDLCEYMELSEEACETLVLLEEVIHQSDVFSEQAQTLTGDYYALVLLSYYSISAVHTIERVKKGEIDPDMAKFEVYSKLKQEISDALSSFLVSYEKLTMDYKTVKADGFVDSYLNPPRMTLKRTDYLTKFPVEALELYDLVAEALEPFSKTRYDPKRPFYTDKSKFNLWVQTKGGRVGMMISQFTGSVEVTATTENPMEDAMEAVDKVGQALYRAGLPVDPEEFGLMLSEGAMNPQRAQVIILSGPSGSGKSTTIRNLLKALPGARTAPTITTRRKRKSDKPGERVFVGKGEFLHMASQGDLVAVQLQKGGDYYAKRLSDFEKEGYVVIEVSLNGLNQIKKIFPTAYTVYLEPVDDPEMIRKRLLRRGDMSAKDAKGRAAIIPQHIAASKKMDFDLRIPMKQGEFDVAAKKIIEMVPKKNPNGTDTQSTLPPELTAAATVSPLSAEEWNTPAGERKLRAIRKEREEAYAAAVKEREEGYRQATIEEILPQSIVWDYTKRGTGLDMTDEYEIVDIPVEELEEAFKKSPMYVAPNSGGKVEGIAVAAEQETPLPVLQGVFVGEAFEFTAGRHRFAYTRDYTQDYSVPVAVYATRENPRIKDAWRK
jgi:guanylate kinase